MTTERSSSATYAPASRHVDTRSSVWGGWIGFAAMMLIVIGMFQAIEGFVAIFQDDYYAVSKNGLVVHLDYTGWGWILLILAVVNILAGIGVLRVKTWARVWAIGAATVSLIANVGFTSAYPVWTVMLVALDVIVIYALCVHWDDAGDSL